MPYRIPGEIKDEIKKLPWGVRLLVWLLMIALCATWSVILFDKRESSSITDDRLLKAYEERDYERRQKEKLQAENKVLTNDLISCEREGAAAYNLINSRAEARKEIIKERQEILKTK